MKKWIIRAAILLAYCIPYIFLSMQYDLNNWSILGYGGMIIAFLVLMILCINTNNITIGIMGNIMTFSTSYLCISNITIEKWNWYFKPFTAHGLLKFVSVVLLLIQLVFWIVDKKKEHVE